jgi:hypothetical protein
MLKGSLQLRERNKPSRDLIGLTKEFASASLAANCGKTLLARSDHQFV